jgi:putative endonuclease
MNESQSLGQKGENEAALYLEKKGYRIRHRNWKSGKLELDIVAENSDYIVFVEVKTRTEEFIIQPGDIVNNQKQKSILFAADGYIKRYNLDVESRFDIITVVSKNNSFEIEHIEAAFYPTLR